MMNIRIKSRRKALKLTQSQVGLAISVTKATVSQWESGDTSPNGENLQNLAKCLSCSPDWLISGKDRPIVAANTVAVPISLNAPLISWIQAGTFCDNRQLEPIDETTEYYPCPVKKAGPRTFALQVKGDSMTAAYPGMRSYPEGTIIFVDPDLIATPGQRVIARLGNNSTFKQLMEDESGLQYLKPLNERHDLIKPDDGVHVCGVVIGAFMPE